MGECALDVKNAIEQAIANSSVFEKNEVLNTDYLPKGLLHREKQINSLTINFKFILTNPGNYSANTVVYGNTGVGKTATVRKFGENFAQIGRERGIRFVYTHINCHRHRTLYLMLMEVARQTKISVPNRGLSAQEVFKIIYDSLEKKDMYLIIALDEFDYFIGTSSPEDIYFLVKVYDELNYSTKRINYIFVMRDLNILSTVDKSLKDQIMKSVIEFPPYTSQELFDIMKERITNEKAFKEGAVEEEALKFISDIYGADKGGSGNARLALETLELAGKIADSENSLVVTTEHVKKANSQINPELSVIMDSIGDLDIHQLLILRAVIDLYKVENTYQFPIGIVEEQYKLVANELGETPRRHTQVYEYIRRMKLMGLLVTGQSGKGMRGRSTLVSLAFPVTTEVENIIIRKIQELKSKSEQTS